MEKTKVFISYAHRDKSYFDIFLSNLKSQSDWEIWTDRSIEIGSDWFESIQNAMQQSDAAVLLISPDFISSEFIKEKEFRKFNELKESNPSFVFLPIFLRDCKYSRWKDLSKLQMFVAYGDEYGVPDKKGQMIPFAELCRFDDNQQLVPNAKIDTFFKNLVHKADTEVNIAKSRAENNSDKSVKAKEIEQLRSIKKIFLSIPDSAQGNGTRYNFIGSVDLKIKYELPKWPYEIIPGIIEVREGYDNKDAEQKKQFLNSLDEFIYSILIISAADDLKSPMFTFQYELAKKANARSSLDHTILWFLNSEAKNGFDLLDEELRVELKMLPNYVGTDITAIFRQIEDFDKKRERKITQLSMSFSPGKKVYMFYDPEKDDDNSLRIQLRKKIQEEKNFSIRDTTRDLIEDQKKEIEEYNGAIIFYGADCNSVWYKEREKIIVKAKNIKCGAVCVDGSEDSVIEHKIDKDVSVNEILPIKGQKELDSGVTNFKKKLQEE